MNADSNLQFKVTITSGENGQLVGKLHTHTHTLPVSLGTGLNQHSQAHATHTHTQLTSCCCCFTIDNTDEPLKQNGSTTKRDTAQNKRKMEEAPACVCVDKQRKTTNPCPNRNYLLGSHTFWTRFTHSLTQHFLFGKSPGTIERGNVFSLFQIVQQIRIRSCFVMSLVAFFLSTASLVDDWIKLDTRRLSLAGADGRLKVRQFFFLLPLKTTGSSSHSRR